MVLTATGDGAGAVVTPLDRRIEFLAPVLIWLGAVLLLGVLGVAIAVYGPKDGAGTSRRRA